MSVYSEPYNHSIVAAIIIAVFCFNLNIKGCLTLRNLLMGDSSVKE